jgi:hypothetical protein
MTNYTFQSLFDFTRTTSGTFVGSNGLIQTTPASVNLLTQTQQFDNAAWTKSNSTVTANAAVAPDGTSTADKLVEAATTSSHYVLQAPTVTATTHVFSVYAKAGERSFVSLGFDGLNVWFNLTTGAVGTIEAGLTAAIVSVGDGWYRCSAIRTVTVAGSKSSVIYSASADNALSYTGNGTSGIFIWGAQLEQAATATTYTRNNGGVYPARFDYDPATLAPKGILIEEQRVNLLLRSEEFDNAIWQKAAATATANATTAPDGTSTADKVVATATTAFHGTYQAPTGTVASYTYSVYAKAAEYSKLQIANSTAGTWSATFDLATGATIATGGVSVLSSSIQSVGNGWYRCSIAFTGAAIPVAHAMIGYPNTGATLNNFGVQYTGDGTSGLFLWGAQLELGAFATSYIPTVASTVTRTADQCSIVAPMFAPWYNQSEGTFVMDASPVNNGCYALSATDGTANEEIILRYASSGTAAVVRDGGTIQANFGTGVLTGKNALAYRVNDFAVSTNGGAAATDTSGTIPTNNQVSLGRALDGSLNINGHIRSIRYYPFRASNNQLQALTA